MTEPGRSADEFHALASTGPDAESPTRYGALAHLVRRIVLRLTRHEREHQAKVDIALFDSLNERISTVESRLGEPNLEQPAPYEIKTVDPRDRFKLAFTGDASAEEFESACKAQEHWYHSYYFDNGYGVQGDYDIGADIGEYGFPTDMSGMSVLDIGTGAGWFAHYFNQLGADVTTVDARGYCDFDVYGRYDYPDVTTMTDTGSSPKGGGDQARQPDLIDDDGRPIYFSPVSGGFFVMRDLLRADIDFVNARAYEVSPKLFGGKKFDLVFMGALLCHLRDPIGALMAARSVCKGRLIVSTPVVLGDPEEAPMQYLPYTEMDLISWWLPNATAFEHWIRAAGFANVDVSRSVPLRCDIPFHGKTGRQLNQDQIHRVGHATV